MKASKLLRERRERGLTAADIPKDYSGPDPEAVREWLEASCAKQGISVVITDPVVIAQVAVLLRAGS